MNERVYVTTLLSLIDFPLWRTLWKSNFAEYLNIKRSKRAMNAFWIKFIKLTSTYNFILTFKNSLYLIFYPQTLSIKQKPDIRTTVTFIQALKSWYWLNKPPRLNGILMAGNNTKDWVAKLCRKDIYPYGNDIRKDKETTLENHHRSMAVSINRHSVSIISAYKTI